MNGWLVSLASRPSLELQAAAAAAATPVRTRTIDLTLMTMMLMLSGRVEGGPVIRAKRPPPHRLAPPLRGNDLTCLSATMMLLLPLLPVCLGLGIAAASGPAAAGRRTGRDPTTPSPASNQIFFHSASSCAIKKRDRHARTHAPLKHSGT
ncbi:hypothetical protein BS50DRAFT_392785 [Corynespora cassiicola Philippines]|uniref:Uncharacterized protein n=1 Tax=Corynespora cassiicola Philippines TaxID=1448308 RepID=A0A2T2NPV8_CORCC|nr:hypothetical protein BS50DRAFT_392785 [Corynespora cassiicola Philippines]